MGGKNSAPPPPDYSKVAAASEKSAKYAYDLGKEQLAWAKEQYAKDSVITQQVVDAALKRQDLNDTAAIEDRERYKDIYQPLEDQLAQEAQDYASPERQQYEMGRAGATVATNFQAQRKAAAQNLEAYGVDPSSTRYAALDAGSRVAQAASQAAAQNNAQVQTEAVGRALRSEAINVGRGYPGQVAQTYGTALQSGNQGANTQLANTATGANTMGTGTQWQGLGNQAIGQWGNTLNMGYQNQMSQYNANQASSSGLGSLLGAGAGIASAFFEDGGAVPSEVTPGGNVPASASPSQGKAIDDVPARLTAGEFVVPKDVMSWKGEEFFQNVINKSREAKPKAKAKPEYALAPKQAATFTSRPAGALPTG